MNWKNIFSVCSVYVAVIIGAEFVTGKEISAYFISCGVKGLLGIIIASFLIAFCSYSILLRVHLSQINDYAKYLHRIMPAKISKLVRVVMVGFLLCEFFAMITVGGTLLNKYYSMPKYLSCGLISMLCFIILIHPMRLLVKISVILAPLIAIGILVSGSYIIFLREESVPVFASIQRKFQFIYLSIFYAGDHLILASVILVFLKDYVENKRCINYISLISGFIVFVLLGFVFAVIQIYDGKILLGQIPMLTIMARMGENAKILYTLMLLLAIFLTATSSGYGFTYVLSSTNTLKRALLSFFICFAAMVFSAFPILFFIKYLIGIFSVCGLFLIICILCDGIKLIISEKIKIKRKMIKKVVYKRINRGKLK